MKKNIMNIIDHIEIIANAAEGQDRSFRSMQIPKESIKIVSDFLSLNQTQTIIFSVILILSFNKSSVDIQDIANYISCSTITIARHLKDFNQIEKSKLVRLDYKRRGFRRAKKPSLFDISYSITTNVLNALLESNINLIKRVTKMDMVTLLESIFELFEERDDGDLSFDEVVDEVEYLLKQNSNLFFVNRLNTFQLSQDENMLLLYICRETVAGRETTDLSEACDKIFESASIRFNIRRNIIQQKNELTRHELVELEDGNFRNDREIKLTEKAMNFLFEEEASVFVNNKKKKDSRIIDLKSIEPKTLFFKQATQDQLKELSSIMSELNYLKVKKRLTDSGLPVGMNFLFYGPPGTGKTASVFQLAHETKRDIMMVDISQTKSMWFGESEKIIKQVFSDYRNLVEKEKVTPILLFNECDAVFGKRGRVDHSAVDQTQNAIQNIILQQMEDMDGILMATTNLTVNLDPAFERRFLYKIRFPNPSHEVCSKIWNDKIQILTKRQADKLALQFPFPGGNIENIARKITMKEVVKDNSISFKQILEYCENEVLQYSERVKIGF